MAQPDVHGMQTVTTRSGPVRVLDTGGDDIPLLLVHSLLVDGFLYARLVPLLTARGHRCIVPDLPLGAHGEPMRPDADLSPTGLAGLLVDVLDALDVPVAHVVGVDTGGALTQILMADHTDRVGRVVLTACDAYDAFPPRSVVPLAVVLRRSGPTWLMAQSARLRPLRALGNLRMLTHSGVSDDVLVQWTTPMRDTAIRRDLVKVVRGMHPRYTLAAAEKNKKFPRPVLVAWGEDARVFPKRLGEQLASEIPDARLVTLSDCAAFAALDQPELLADLIDAHVTAENGAVGR